MNGWRGPTPTEVEAAAQLAPETVQSYLVTAGWRPHPEVEEQALWTLVADNHEFELLLPDRRYRDYPLRMFDVLHTLSVVEERGIEAVLAELSATDLDTITFRLLPGGPAGTVPLVNGADALAGVRELVMASTYATMLGRPLMVQGRRPARVQQFVERVQLGTPRAGSWIISAQLRLSAMVPGTEAPDLFFSDTDAPDPFPRQVSLQAHRAVRAALWAAGEALQGDPVEPFRRRVEEGVSANVCEALAKLGREETPYEVRFGWATSHIPPAGVRRFRFDAPVIRALKEAAERLRTLPDGRAEVIGLVTKLTRAPRGDAGDVVITGEAHIGQWAAEQKVKVRLGRDLYDRAVQAHQHQRAVRLTGVASRGKVETVFDMTIEDG
jgi:hypothetical protein